MSWPPILSDLRLALRSFGRRPLLLTGAALSLALAIGANGAVLSFVGALFLRPLPVEDPASLVRVFTVSEETDDLYGLSFPNFVEYRQSPEPFSDLAAFRATPLRVRLGDTTEEVRGELVSTNYFGLLGVEAALGRTFADGPFVPGGRPEVVLADDFWRRRFGADPAVAGRPISVNGHAYTVAGVAPAGFRGINLLSSPDLWVPLDMHGQVLFGRLAEWFPYRDAMILNAVARLPAGTGVAAASAGARTTAGRLAAAYPDDNRGLSLELVPLTQATIHPSLRPKLMLAAMAVLAMVLLLLALACVNVANLLVARAIERRRETGIRLAIGAPRALLLRQLLAEGLLLATLGGAAGLLLAVWGRDLLWALRPAMLPDSLEVAIDHRVLLWTAAIVLACSVIFGLVPALQSLRGDLTSSIKGVGTEVAAPRRRLKLQDLLVVVQVALATVCLVAAGLFVLQLRAAERIDLGFAPQSLLVATVDLGVAGYDEARGDAFQRRLLERLAALPGVRSAALAERIPFETRPTPQVGVAAAGRPPDDGERWPMAAVNTVSPGFLDTLGVDLLRGRALTDADRDREQPVAVVNRSLAERLWPGQDPVGRRFSVEGEAAPYEVVGVVRDFEYRGVGDGPDAYFVRPLGRRHVPDAALHLRTDGDPLALLPAVRATLAELDRNLALRAEGTVEQLRREALWAPRAAAGLLSAFGLVGLVLAAIGVYSVLAFSVSRRGREIGIRMALGAGREEVHRLILRQGLALVGLGVGLGWLAAVAAGPLAGSLLTTVRWPDPRVFGAAALALLATSAIAVLVPARRATRVDPKEVLVAE